MQSGAYGGPDSDPRGPAMRTIRLAKPTVAHVAAIHARIAPHVASARVLPRSPRQIVERLRDYTLALRDGEVVGVASVALIDTDLAEVGVLVGDDNAIEGDGKPLVIYADTPKVAGSN